MKRVIFFFLVVSCVVGKATQLQSLTQVDNMVKCRVALSKHLLGLGCSKAYLPGVDPNKADRGVFQAFKLDKLLTPNYNQTSKFEQKWMVSRISRQKATTEWQQAEINVALAHEQPKTRLSDIFGLNKEQAVVNTNVAQPWFSFTVDGRDGGFVVKVEQERTAIRFYDQLQGRYVPNVIAFNINQRLIFDYRTNPLNINETQFVACTDDDQTRKRLNVECDFYTVARDPETQVLSLTFKKMNKLTTNPRAGVCARSLQLTDKGHVILSCYNAPTRGFQGTIIYRLDDETLVMREMYRMKVKTPRFVPPKYWEMDENLSVLFYVNQEPQKHAGDTWFDWTFVNTVELLSDRDKPLTQALTVNRRYQLYSTKVDVKQEDKDKKNKLPPSVELDVYNVLGKEWPTLVISIFNETREATSVYYTPYCGLRQQPKIDTAGMSTCQDIPGYDFIYGPSTFVSPRASELNNTIGGTCTMGRSNYPWFNTVQAYACSDKDLSSELQSTARWNGQTLTKVDVTTPMTQAFNLKCDMHERIGFGAAGINGKTSIPTDACVPCGAACLDCGDGMNSCSKCVDGTNLVDGQCLCPEEENWFDAEAKVCKPCAANCTQCINDTFCLKCYDDLGADKNGICTACDFHHFFNATSHTCEECADKCAECSPDKYFFNTQCTRCDDGYHLDAKSDCVYCLEATVFNIETSKCEPCQEGCAKCSAPDTCLECKAKEEGFFPAEGGTCLNCTGSNYYNATDMTCNACAETCLTCESDTVCTECANDTRGDNVTEPFYNFTYKMDWSNMCIECEDGKYFRPDIKRCVPCQANCEKCTDPKHCSQCRDPFQLLIEQVVIAVDENTTITNETSWCPSCEARPGYYMDQDTMSCKHCDFHPSKCLCDDGLFFNKDEATCTECDPLCATCSNGWTCDSCNATTVLIDDISQPNWGLCGNCDNRTRALNGSCINCPLGCDICHRDNESTPIVCDACSANSTLDPETAQCTCNKGFASQTNSTLDFSCDACPPQCEECHYEKNFHKLIARCKKCENGHTFVYELNWWQKLTMSKLQQTLYDRKCLSSGEDAGDEETIKAHNKETCIKDANHPTCPVIKEHVEHLVDNSTGISIDIKVIDDTSDDDQNKDTKKEEDKQSDEGKDADASTKDGDSSKADDEDVSPLPDNTNDDDRFARLKREIEEKVAKLEELKREREASKKREQEERKKKLLEWKAEQERKRKEEEKAREEEALLEKAAKQADEAKLRREEERLAELREQIKAEAERLAIEKKERLARLKREIEEATREALETVEKEKEEARKKLEEEAAIIARQASERVRKEQRERLELEKHEKERRERERVARKIESDRQKRERERRTHDKWIAEHDEQAKEARKAADSLAKQKEDAASIKQELEEAARRANEQLLKLREAQDRAQKERLDAAQAALDRLRRQKELDRVDEAAAREEAKIDAAKARVEKALLNRLKVEIKEEAEKLAKLKAEQERQEKERQERLRRQSEQDEKDRLERVRAQKEREERARLRKIKEEEARITAELAAAEKKKQAEAEEARLAKLKEEIAAEGARLAKIKEAQRQAESARLERLKKEQLEAEKARKARLEKEEEERLAKIAREKEHKERERQFELQRERIQLEREALEKEVIEREKEEKIRLEKLKLEIQKEAKRIANMEAEAKIEEERLALEEKQRAKNEKSRKAAKALNAKLDVERHAAKELEEKLREEQARIEALEVERAAAVALIGKLADEKEKLKEAQKVADEAARIAAEANEEEREAAKRAAEKALKEFNQLEQKQREAEKKASEAASALQARLDTEKKAAKELKEQLEAEQLKIKKIEDENQAIQDRLAAEQLRMQQEQEAAAKALAAERLAREKAEKERIEMEAEHKKARLEAEQIKAEQEKRAKERAEKLKEHEERERNQRERLAKVAKELEKLEELQSENARIDKLLREQEEMRRAEQEAERRERQRQGNFTNEFLENGTSLYLEVEPEVDSLTAGEECLRLTVEPASVDDIETVVAWDIDMLPLESFIADKSLTLSKSINFIQWCPQERHLNTTLKLNFTLTDGTETVNKWYEIKVNDPFSMAHYSQNETEQLEAIQIEEITSGWLSGIGLIIFVVSLSALIIALTVIVLCCVCCQRKKNEEKSKVKVIRPQDDEQPNVDQTMAIPNTSVFMGDVSHEESLDASRNHAYSDRDKFNTHRGMPTTRQQHGNEEVDDFDSPRQGSQQSPKKEAGSKSEVKKETHKVEDGISEFDPVHHNPHMSRTTAHGFGDFKKEGLIDADVAWAEQQQVNRDSEEWNTPGAQIFADKTLMTILATDNRWCKATNDGNFAELLYGVVLTRLQMGVTNAGSLSPPKAAVQTRPSSNARFIPSRFEKAQRNDIISLQSDPTDQVEGASHALLEGQAFNFNAMQNHSKSEAKRIVPQTNPNMWTDKEFDEQIRTIEAQYEQKRAENMTSIGDVTNNEMATIPADGGHPIQVPGIRAGTADVKFRPSTLKKNEKVHPEPEKITEDDNNLLNYLNNGQQLASGQEASGMKDSKTSSPVKIAQLGNSHFSISNNDVSDSKKYSASKMSFTDRNDQKNSTDSIDESQKQVPTVYKQVTFSEMQM